MAKAKKTAATKTAVSSKTAAPKKAAAAPAKSIKLGGVPNQGNKRGK